jgi:NitT/TauT family transport system substrate-binding protein
MGTRRAVGRLLGGGALALAVAVAGSALAAWPAPGAAASDASAATLVRAEPVPHGAPVAAMLPQLQPVRIGVVETSSEVGIALANDRGYFTEQGLAPEYVRFESAAFAVAPLSIGEIDVASGVVSAGLFNAINRGVELRIAGPQSRYEAGHGQVQLMVRKDLADSGVMRDYADLRGRTLAINATGSTVELLAERALRRGGLAMSDANIVQLGFGDQLPAFANRAIDVGLTAEPTSTLAVDRGLAVKWREADEWSPGIQVSMVLYGPNYVNRNPDAGQRYMVAYLRGVRDSYSAMIAGRGDRESVIQTMIRHTPLKDRALYDRMSWVYIDPNLRIDENDLRATMQWLVERGLVDQPTDLNVAIDRRFAQHALGVLGPYQ